MKDKRNCGYSYPMYPQQMIQPFPTMPVMPTPYQAGYNQGYTNNSLSSNTVEQQLNNLEQQIRDLDQRVSRLESLNNTSNNKYNNSNYYMV